MKIRDLFRRDVTRRIEEVIKVDAEASVAAEIDEYVVTDHIAGELDKILNIYQETILTPSEETNVWISGFFGSGKSSFAKILGYLLENPALEGRTATDHFFAIHDLPSVQAILNTIHAQAPSRAVFLDLSQSTNVLNEAEAVVLPVYRALLDALGYSRDLTLAELEYTLEGREQLGAFEEAFGKAAGGARTWRDSRHVILAKNEASHALHLLEPSTYPSPDSWAKSASMPDVNENWFAKRAVELLARRGEGATRLVFVVDEAGQYVARSIDRMRHLQGLAQAIQKERGKLWLVVTSQERLNDVVDSLEGRQIELARAIDRFPIRVDLLPSDIDEVAGKRVLGKTADAEAELRSLYDQHRNQLASSTRLESTRESEFGAEDFVRLYPMVPYQVQLLIDAVSARRSQGGAPRTMGGSNRTIIKHAQQLVANPRVGLAESPVGQLVTLDRSYDLLEEVIPTSWRSEVDQVADTFGENALETRVMKVVALCLDVPAVPLTVRNLAALLHPTVDADSIEPNVREALDHLVSQDRLRQTDAGYRLQSPEQKDWQRTRRGIEMRPGDETKLRKRILREKLGALAITRGRTFKIQLVVEGEKLSDGVIELEILNESDVERLRTLSRETTSASRIFWAFRLGDDTWEALEEVHRSSEMISRKDNPNKTAADVELLAEERGRRDRAERLVLERLTADLAAGKAVFRGEVAEPPKGSLVSMAESIVTERIEDVYTRLDLFAGSYTREQASLVLRADDLDGLPELLGESGLGLFRLTPTGRELITDSGPIDSVVQKIRERHQYGEEATGLYLEQNFGGPPYGASPEALQVVLAAAIRASLVEVITQAQRITSTHDQRLGEVFRTLPRFRSAAFRPASEHGPGVDERASVAEWIASFTGSQPGLALEEVAAAVRDAFRPLRDPCTGVLSALTGLGIPVPDVVTRTRELLGQVLSTDDEMVVTTAHGSRSDLDAGRKTVIALADLVDGDLDVLRDARRLVDQGVAHLPQEAQPIHNDLADLLRSGKLGDDIARIRHLAGQLDKLRTQATQEARLATRDEIDAAVERLRSRHPTVEDDVFDEATQALHGLGDEAIEDLAVLVANRQAVSAIEQRAATVLDRVAATREVAYIEAAAVWPYPITSEAELDNAMERLRAAAAERLADDTEVRFR
ncbi:MAG: BREX system P-loop protein BrxC [Acidimicrobiia bacterium]